MKNIYKGVGIVIMVMIIAFSMIGCSLLGFAPSTSGELTLTDFDIKYDGKYVYAVGTNFSTTVAAASSINVKGETIALGRISNGRVTLKVWEVVTEGETEKFIEYKGDDTIVFGVAIYDKSIISNAESESTEAVIASGLAGATFTTGFASASAALVVDK
ncbi:MAG: hypothetical protein LBV20_01935 [Treponema sp.]|jgi:hypothetical protein|nr:hypothetical protein [Treponema sp.]